MMISHPSFSRENLIMASIRKDIPIQAPARDVWDAVRDFGALHTRLVPGFVLDTKLDGEARIVTFASGTVARELLIDCDDARRRLAYAVISERMKHYSASVEVVADGDTNSRVIWTVDLLPHEIAPYVSGQMEQGVLAMQKTLGRAAA
jgi:Polyketide cyclase / dehydrase and lipid transport